MALSDSDLELVRDEVGDSPDDGTLYTYYDELGTWVRVALRVLRRRRSGLVASAGMSVAVPGVVSFSSSSGSTLASLDRQIARLEALDVADGGDPDPSLPEIATSTRMVRRDTPWRHRRRGRFVC